MSETITFYGTPLSGNAYKVRLFLSLLGLEFQEVDVDWKKGETRSESFLRINPRGQVPVIQDGDLMVWDSQAILAYLARTYAEEWFPVAPTELAQVMQWLAVSENEILYGLACLRAAKVYGIRCDIEQVAEWSYSVLAIMNTHLQAEPWLAVQRPTVADIACFPYVALSWQGGVDLDDYPSVARWIEQIRSLPRFVSMEGLTPAG